MNIGISEFMNIIKFLKTFDLGKKYRKKWKSVVIFWSSIAYKLFDTVQNFASI